MPRAPFLQHHAVPLACAASLFAACSESATRSDPSSTSTGATGNPTSGAGGAGGAGGSGAGGSHPERAALRAACTPTLTLKLQDKGPGGKLFTDAVPDPEGFVTEIGRRVCSILYRHASEVGPANHLTLLIKQDPTPGWKAGDGGDITVMISTTHLTEVANQGLDVATEIEGILHHEMTHMYQYDDKAPGEGTYANLGHVIEGVADAVRIRAKFPPPGAGPLKSGVWDDEGYWKPAFFLLWIDTQVPDFLYELNASMRAGDGVAWTPEAIHAITGSSVDALWAQYKGASCCAGTQWSCCAPQ